MISKKCTESLEQFLEQVAHHGSWFGGGSVAAFSAALAAALLEKTLGPSPASGRLHRIRRECVTLIRRDAQAFARAIQAARAGRREAFRRALRRAIDIPCRVVERAQAIRAMSHSYHAAIAPAFQSDRACAEALAKASAESARALIAANLAWLGDRGYTQQIRRRLRHALPRDGR